MDLLAGPIPIKNKVRILERIQDTDLKRLGDIELVIGCKGGQLYVKYQYSDS